MTSAGKKAAAVVLGVGVAAWLAAPGPALAGGGFSVSVGYGGHHGHHRGSYGHGGHHSRGHGYGHHKHHGGGYFNRQHGYSHSYGHYAPRYYVPTYRPVGYYCGHCHYHAPSVAVFHNHIFQVHHLGWSDVFASLVWHPSRHLYVYGAFHD